MNTTEKNNARRIPFFSGLLAGISGTFAGLTFYSGAEGTETMWMCWLLLLTASLLVFAFYPGRREPKPSYSYEIPYFAEKEDINRCLKALNGHPMKLVVSNLFARPGVEEKPWVIPKWAFEEKNGTLVKPAFVTTKDVFQFSVADARSRQDWHFHDSVFEIFLSAYPIMVEYLDTISPDIQTLEVRDGMLMLPPGLKHKVTLNGMTYVFQATLAEDGGINQDKTLVEM
jgi:hypothetical protein